jgi:hypothetical protein
MRMKPGLEGEGCGGLGGRDAGAGAGLDEDSVVLAGLTGDRSSDSDESSTGDKQEKESSQVGTRLGMRGEASGWCLG